MWISGTDIRDAAGQQPAVSDQACDGYRRRHRRITHHSNSYNYFGATDLYQVTGTNFLHTETCRKEWQNVQDVQVPYDVSGCGGTEESTYGAEPGGRWTDV